MYICEIFKQYNNHLMRKFLLLSFLLILGFSLQAQIESGTKLASNIKTKDIKGNNVDIFADLDAGKTVIIDVFATWCAPCWAFHNSGIFKELYATYGPTGTDQIRAYGLEADPTTPLNHLFQAVNSNPSSIGDWTKGVDYPIINDHTYNDLLKIDFFPTLYVIRPDRTVLEVGNSLYDINFWKKAILPNNDKDAIFISSLSDRTFCKTTIFAQRPTIINMGNTEINSINASISYNGEESLVSFNNTLGVFKKATLNFGNKTLDASTEVKMKIEDIDDVKITDSEYNELTAYLLRPTSTEKQFTVLFTTDFYPSETSWDIKDNKNRVVFNQPNYRAGNADQYGGGGPDANKEFRYDITIPNDDVDCLTLTIRDSYQDGFYNFAGSDPFPGVVFLNDKGEVIKPKFISDFDFKATNRIYMNIDFTTGLEEQPFVQGLKVYPNPVGDILNVDLQINDDVDYQLFITDIMGKQVSDISLNANFINVSSLTSGMYFLNVRTKDGIYAHKFNKI